MVSHTAERFTNAPINTRPAARQRFIARVPFVVVNTTLRPPTVSGRNSDGELPKSKPAIGKPSRSPPNGFAGRQSGSDSPGLVDFHRGNHGPARRPRHG